MDEAESPVSKTTLWVPMLEPEIVRQMRALKALRWGTKRIAAEVGVSLYAKPKLLVVDELGYLPLENQTAHRFFQLVGRRYERGSMLITTNQTITHWGHVFGDKMIAAAVLDRVLHHSQSRVGRRRRC